MRIPVWPGVRLSVWERQNPEAVKVVLARSEPFQPVRRVLSMRGWMLLWVRYDWRDYRPSPQLPGFREVRVVVEAPSDENAGQWAETIRDLVVAEYGESMRLNVTIAPGGRG